tara:strand:- start:145 stop:930 length:786 start_codon:yes stop_codon:yes gene_type:complete
MEYKYKKENHDFWVQRLKNNSPDTVCTNDIALDGLESQQIIKAIKEGQSILEIGCGNGLLYEQICNKINLERYIGTDFVNDLVKECERKKKSNSHEFMQLDMTEVDNRTFNEKFDVIISKRAIQNVIDQDLQLKAIDNFGQFLNDDGLMVLVESSSTAQNNINLYREKYNLDKIIPPFHNLFFNDEILSKYNFKNVKLEKIVPFASDFYFITRLIYARYAKEYLKESPTFQHPFQKIAITMDNNSTNKFSQIQTYIFKKKL